MGRAGLEHTHDSPGNTDILSLGGAKCVALSAAHPSADPSLALIGTAWHRLPEAVKAGIVAMVKASAADSEP